MSDRTFGTSGDAFAKFLDAAGIEPDQPEEFSLTSESENVETVEYELFTWEGEPVCTLLLISKDAIYVARHERKIYLASVSKLERGAIPEGALPSDHTRIECKSVSQLKHQQDSEWIEFSYHDAQGKAQTVGCGFANRSQANHVVSRAIALIGLERNPHQEQASIRDITIGPAIVTGMPLIMLIGCFLIATLGDLDEADAPRGGRAGALKAVTKLLGPTGLLIAMGVVSILGLSYWGYRLINRPTVDIFKRPAVATSYSLAPGVPG